MIVVRQVGMEEWNVAVPSVPSVKNRTPSASETATVAVLLLRGASLNATTAGDAFTVRRTKTLVQQTRTAALVAARLESARVRELATTESDRAVNEINGNDRAVKERESDRAVNEINGKDRAVNEIIRIGYDDVALVLLPWTATLIYHPSRVTNSQRL
jgi:hypothetical protein